MKQRISMGSSEQALVITNLGFDEDGFAIDQKAGIVAFNPEHDPGQVLAKAAAFEWELYGVRNLQGFYSVRKKRELTTEEKKSQTVSSTGRSVSTELKAEEIASGHAARPSEMTNTPSRINQDALITHDR